MPPTGGHPGEDYNCRCWAEPYRPERYADKPMMVDVSGLDMFKEQQKTLMPADLSPQNSLQYAANDKTNVASDATYTSNSAYAHRKVKFRSPEEEKLLRHMAKIVVKHENIKEHPYLDNVGKITVGKGMNVDNWNLFKSVHWLIDGRPATENEVKAMYDELGRQRERLQREYEAVQKFKREHPLEYARWPESKKKDHGPFNYTADYYAQFTNIRITADEADYLMFSHLQDDYDTIKGYLGGFDNRPMGIKEAAFDIQYNTGNIRSFGKFKKAYNANDISGMAKESGRIIISKERNNDIKGRILKTK